jgi:hypothetical protein
MVVEVRQSHHAAPAIVRFDNIMPVRALALTGAAQGSGSDRWTTDKARDGNVPNCQGAVRLSRLGVHFNTTVGD